MADMPRDGRPDATLSLLRDPYGYVPKRCRRYGSDAFLTRLQLRPTICLTGPEAAELFYDRSRFTREGAAPGRLQKTLFGRGGVQGLDGEEHRHRKAMLVSVATRERVAELAAETERLWPVFVEKWSVTRVVLYHEMQELLTRAVCSWAGVPLPEADVERRTRELTRLFDAAAAVGPKHWLARRARDRADDWIREFVVAVRKGEATPAKETAAHAVAWHRDTNGELLDPRIAAVELLNVLRPTVAVSVYLTFAALALHRHPERREELAQANDAALEAFAQEVRRFYPFFPFLVARVREEFTWGGFRFPAGRTVMLDLYGTNHDQRAWDAPHEFRPERFLGNDVPPFGFIPQGGGDVRTKHRCPGDGIAVELLKVAVRFLVSGTRYSVPEQDLELRWSRPPGLPRSGFVIDRVQPLVPRAV